MPAKSCLTFSDLNYDWSWDWELQNICPQLCDCNKSMPETELKTRWAAAPSQPIRTRHWISQPIRSLVWAQSTVPSAGEMTILIFLLITYIPLAWHQQPFVFWYNYTNTLQHQPTPTRQHYFVSKCVIIIKEMAHASKEISLWTSQNIVT